MKILSNDEMQELRKDVASLGISAERSDELIRVLDAIAASFVDQAFGLDAVQISLSIRANYAFNGADACANLPEYQQIKRVDDAISPGGCSTP